MMAVAVLEVSSELTRLTMPSLTSLGLRMRRRCCVPSLSGLRHFARSSWRGLKRDGRKNGEHCLLAQPSPGSMSRPPSLAMRIAAW